MLTRRKRRRISTIVLTFVSVLVALAAVGSAGGYTVSFAPVLLSLFGFR